MKTLKFFLIIALLCVSGFAKAQDVIVKKDNSTILSKVIEINSSEIKYKKWSNLDGPIYSIYRTEVLSINYQNGEVEYFNDNPDNQGFNKQEQCNITRGYMERKGKHLYLNGNRLSDEDVRTLVGEENYKTYKSAKSQISAGRFNTAMFIITLAGTVGLAAAASANNNDAMISAYVCGSVSELCLLCMCIQKGAGKGRMNWVADEYNKKQNTNYSLNLSPSIIKCNAPKLQDNYGLTFSMNF